MKAIVTVATREQPRPSVLRRPQLALWLATGFLGVFTLLAVVVLVDGVSSPDRIDVRIGSAAHALILRHHTLLSVTHGVTVLGSMTVLTPLVSGVTLLLLWRRLWRQAVVLVTATLASSLLVGLLKVAIGRPRPVFGTAVAHAGGYAFPSGHATSSATVFGVLIVIALPFVRPRLQPFAAALTFALVAAICASRVLLGVHWTSDVIAGACLGAALSCAAIVALRPASAVRCDSASALHC